MKTIEQAHIDSFSMPCFFRIISMVIEMQPGLTLITQSQTMAKCIFYFL